MHLSQLRATILRLKWQEALAAAAVLLLLPLSLHLHQSLHPPPHQLFPPPRQHPPLLPPHQRQPRQVASWPAKTILATRPFSA